MDNPRLIRIEWARLEGRRPRSAGCNARLGEHGITVRPTIARITAEDGSSGFGACWTNQEQASSLLGAPLGKLFDPARGVPDSSRAFDYPLWDLAGQRAGQPVYALAAAMHDINPPSPYRAPCYDTSLYF